METEVSGLNRIAYDYSCLMARMPDPIAAEVQSVAAAIPPEHIYQTPDGERGRAKDVHVTVLYGIHTTNPDEVLQLVAGMAPLRATLGRTTAFYNPECIALKMDMQSRDLVNLNNLIRKNLQYTSIYPNYIPHITVAYLKKNDSNPYYYRDYMSNDFEGTEVVLGELVFSTPNGKKETIRLGESNMNKTAVATELVKIAKNLVARGRLDDITSLDVYEVYKRLYPDEFTKDQPVVREDLREEMTKRREKQTEEILWSRASRIISAVQAGDEGQFRREASLSANFYGKVTRALMSLCEIHRAANIGELFAQMSSFDSWVLR